MRASANLTAGATNDQQHDPNDQQDDAEGRENRNGQQRAKKEQNQSSDNHACSVPKIPGWQTPTAYCADRDITVATWPEASTCAITVQPLADQKSS